MNCAEFQRDLNDRFGTAGFSDPAKMPRHVDECPSCRETWEQFRLLHEATQLWQKQTGKVDLTRAVVSALASAPKDDEPAAPRPALSQSATMPRRDRTCAPQTSGIVARGPFSGRFAHRRVLLGATAALATLFALGVAWQFLRHEPRGGQPLPEAGSVAGTGPREPDPKRAPNADRAPGLSDPIPYRDLAQRAVGAWGEAAALVMPGPGEGARRRQKPEDSSDWIDGLQHQIRPLGRGLENAFDFLWQAGESADRPRT